MPEEINNPQTIDITSKSQPKLTRTPPWGTVTVLEEGDNYRINRIVVYPKSHISTQMHYHRSEHWIVVSGTAKVIFDGKETLLMPKTIHLCTYEYPSSSRKSRRNSLSHDRSTKW